MPHENTDSTRNESSFGNDLAPFLYMQVDQPPTGSGGSKPAAADNTLDNPDDPAPDTATTDAPTTTEGAVDDATAPIDQPPTGSGG
jgi:hypothetical protein